MSFSTVGACSKCGAPIYAPSMWMGITPPPSSHSCSCFAQVTTVTTTSAGMKIPEVSRTPHKWPTTIPDKEIEQLYLRWKAVPIPDVGLVDYKIGFADGVEWLKSFVEKDKSE